MKDLRDPSQILEQYWDYILPINPEFLSKCCGALVIPDQQLSFSGQFLYEEGKPVIRYNPAESAVRRRFTIAHELGHFVLDHPGGYRDDARAFFHPDEKLNFRERQANQFAAELLMPEDMVSAVIGRLKDANVSSLANTFWVSERAMHFRLKNLGIV